MSCSRRMRRKTVWRGYSGERRHRRCSLAQVTAWASPLATHANLHIKARFCARTGLVHLSIRGRSLRSFYFAGNDISDDAKLAGLMAFFFACYGGGTPQFDDFAHRGHGPQSEHRTISFCGCSSKEAFGSPERWSVGGHCARGAGMDLFLSLAAGRRATWRIRERYHRIAEWRTCWFCNGIFW